MFKHIPKQFSTEPYRWDPYSDQPYPIEDKEFKREVRKASLPAVFFMFLLMAAVLPFVLLRYAFIKKTKLPVQTKGRIGLCVNADKEVEASPGLVAELGITKLSLRVPLSDIENLGRYYDFAKSFKDCEFLIVILQDRRHINDFDLCRQSFRQVFEKFSPLTKRFQIGNAVNRTKWGFISTEESLAFYGCARQVAKQEFDDLDLIGSSVIDFEVYAIVRSIISLKAWRYDGIASLLYVDRRGAPENKQFGFNLLGKIGFIRSVMSLSPNSNDKMCITEVNWPHEYTQPYAPALDDVWVNEQDYANYLLRFYVLALVSGNVEEIYWHQLIAPGYGLIDNRENKLKKRKAFNYLRVLNERVGDMELQSYEEASGLYCVQGISHNGDSVSLYWCNGVVKNIQIALDEKVFSADGDEVIIDILAGKKNVDVTETMIYIVNKAL